MAGIKKSVKNLGGKAKEVGRRLKGDKEKHR